MNMQISYVSPPFGPAAFYLKGVVPPDITLGDIFRSILPYMALASLIALWSRSGGAGIAAGLVIFFAEGLVSQIVAAVNRDLAKVVDYGISRNVQAVQRAGIEPEGRAAQAAAAAAPLPDATQAALVLAAYTVLFVGLAYWRLRSRDVTLS